MPENGKTAQIKSRTRALLCSAINKKRDRERKRERERVRRKNTYLRE